MDILIMVCQLLLGLSILVFIHEFGHYISAKIFKMKVDKFFIFFDAYGKKVFSFKRGETEYGIGVIPLGGYVKIAGMIDESMDTEHTQQPIQPWEFRAKPIWQRMIVMLAGVIINFIFGCAVFAGLLWTSELGFIPIEQLDRGIYSYPLAQNYGLQTGDKVIAINGAKVKRYEDIGSSKFYLGADLLIRRNQETLSIKIPALLDTFKKGSVLFIGAENFQPIISEILPGSNAEKSHFKPGDKIVKLDSLLVSSWGDVKTGLSERKSKTTLITVYRNNALMTISVPVDSMGMIGIKSKAPYTHEKYSLSQSVNYGIKDAISFLQDNIKGFRMIFSGKAKASESIQGPIGIAKIYGNTWEWHKFWVITGMLSLVLAFVNVLPIPALDGGHVLLLCVEFIIRRPLPAKLAYFTQMIGIAMVLFLMLFSIINDILNLFK